MSIDCSLKSRIISRRNPKTAPKRILYLAGGTEGTRVYGAERSLLDLIPRLDRTRFVPCCAVTEGQGPYVSALREMGVPTIDQGLSVGGKLGFGHLTKSLAGARRLTAIVKETGADLIHVNAFKGNHIAALSGWALGIPVICHLQGHVSRQAYFTRLGFGTASFIACSESVAAPWRILVNKNCLQVIYYGLDPQRFSFSALRRQEIRNWLGLSDETFAVGVVSRLSPSKKLELLFQAIQTPEMNRAHVVTLIAGDAPPCWREYALTIRQLPERMGIGHRVVFLGYVDDIASLYCAFDVLVAPSDVEGLGRVILEAMAAERPVIAINSGGPTEVVVEGETGHLVPPGDYQALSSTILELSKDRPQCQQMGSVGRKRVEALFSLDSYVRGVEAVYERVLRESIGSNITVFPEGARAGARQTSEEVL